MRTTEEFEKALLELSKIPALSRETRIIAIEAVNDAMRSHERMRTMTLEEFAANMVRRVNLWIQAHKDDPEWKKKTGGRAGE